MFHLMLAKSDKRFGEVHESFLRPKNLDALGLKWQRNRYGFVEERAETETEVVAVVALHSIFCVFFSSFFLGWLFEAIKVLAFQVDEMR